MATSKASTVADPNILTKAESRHLYKDSPRPRGPDALAEERLLLRDFRKLSRAERRRVGLLVNELALMRIRARLASGRQRKVRQLRPVSNVIRFPGRNGSEHH